MRDGMGFKVGDKLAGSRRSWLLVMKQQVAGYSLGAQGTIHRWWLSHLVLKCSEHMKP